MEVLLSRVRQLKTFPAAEAFVAEVDSSLGLEELNKLEGELNELLRLSFYTATPNLTERIVQIVSVLTILRNHDIEYDFADKPVRLHQEFIAAYGEVFGQFFNATLQSGKDAFDQILD
jgi:hypothetical protein